MSRWSAFAIHLGISLLIIGGLAFGLFYLWYPPHLLGFAKADTLFGLAAGIDIIVGPLLTLLVYKAGKKSLKMDLTVIALLQLGFLSFGLWTIWTTRPVFIVAAFDRYELVFANEVNPDTLPKSRLPEYSRLPLFGPVVVGLRKAEGEDEFFEAVKYDSARHPLFYLTPGRAAELVLSNSRPAAELGEFARFFGASPMERVAQTFAGQAEARFVPFVSFRGDALLEVDAKTGLPLRYIDPDSL
jgi:hypothetical protein